MPHGQLLLTFMSGMAEFERKLILARTGEDRARAKVLGVKMGRKHKLTPHLQIEALARRKAAKATHDIARSYNVSPSTISQLPG